MNPQTLKLHRAELCSVYAAARNRHRGQARAADHLRAATLALLKVEIRQARPCRGRPPKPRPVNLDLFEESHP